MIKKSTYIRSFTPLQKVQLQAIATEHKLKTAPDVLFFALEQYAGLQAEIARLKRIIDYKQNKIERLTNNL